MKKIILFSAFALITIIGSSCTDCKRCSAEVMGVKGPEREYCGEELKAVEQSPGMVCN